MTKKSLGSASTEKKPTSKKAGDKKTSKGADADGDKAGDFTRHSVRTHL